ncbi:MULTISPECIES: hypothetical protein [unclassified Isoptericola]|uniref:hypothetical protein n=1 Tax=unclassified Isoptericola TaxID=2623355 RepID=UPI0036681657
MEQAGPEPRSANLGAAGGAELANGDVIYRVSPGLRVGTAVAAPLWILLFLALTTVPLHPDDTLGSILFGYTLVGGGGVFALLIGRGWIRVSDEGISTRNILTSTWVPWNEVEALESGSKVGIVKRDGQTWWCWAVQRANIAGMLNRRSRVDRVVGEIELRHARATSVSVPEPGDNISRRSLIRPAWWEWIVIAGYVATAIVGLAGT